MYCLVFLTSQPHGFWVFGVSAAEAREKWGAFLGSDPDERENMLWDDRQARVTPVDSMNA